MPTQTWLPRFAKDDPSGPPGKVRKLFANSPFVAFIKLERTDAKPEIQVTAILGNADAEPRKLELEIGKPAYYDAAQALTLVAIHTQGVVVPVDKEASITATWQRDNFPEFLGSD